MVPRHCDLVLLSLASKSPVLASIFLFSGIITSLSSPHLIFNTNERSMWPGKSRKSWEKPASASRTNGSYAGRPQSLTHNPNPQWNPTTRQINRSQPAPNQAIETSRLPCGTSGSSLVAMIALNAMSCGRPGKLVVGRVRYPMSRLHAHESRSRRGWLCRGWVFSIPFRTKLSQSMKLGQRAPH